jgi:hypothetical protein
MSRHRNARDYSSSETTSSSYSTNSQSEDASALSASSESEERLYMHAVNMAGDYAQMVESTQMHNEKNSLAGISLAGLLGCPSDEEAAVPLSSKNNSAKNLASLEEALPRMADYVHKFESRQAMGNLVNTATSSTTTTTKAALPSGLILASDLSAKELAAVHAKTQSLLQQRVQFVELAQLPQEKKTELHARQAASDLQSFQTLSAPQQAQVTLNAQKSERLGAQPLKVTQLMDNSASILKQKGAFDLSFSASIGDASLRAIFDGKPLECSSRADVERASADAILKHLKKHHRHYCDLIDLGGLKIYLCDLVHRANEDYLLLVPTKRYLEALGLDKNKTRIIKVLGSHIALFERKSNAPVLHRLQDRALYDYPTALHDRRIQLRRLDADTIEVNGAWLATRDRVGDGHLYVMKDVSARQLVAEEKRVLQHQDALQQEPRLIDLDTEADSNLKYTQVEEVLSGRQTELMQPVTHIGAYKEPKMSVLLNKMLQPNYNGAKDMASYLTLSAPTTTATATNALQGADLHLKLFDLHDAFNRHLSNELQPVEYMRAVDAHFISAQRAQQLNLGERLDMREYKLDTREQAIRKSDFLNHVAVLSFVRGDQVLMTSFAVNDEPYSRDVYMSPSEGVVLRFKDNLLDCVALNPASQAFDAQAHDGDSLAVNQAISLRFAVDKALSVQLEAHEQTFERFAELVVPLCAPSFVKRAKAALKGAVGNVVVLTQARQPLSLSDDEPEGEESTKRLMVMIGQNALMAAKNKHSYTTQRQTYRSRSNASNYIDVYTFDQAVNKKPLSFVQLVDKKGRPLVLSLTVPNPLTQKPQTVTFKLNSTKNIGGVGAWEASKAGLVFHFEMSGGGDVEKLAIEYQKASAGGSGRRAAKLPDPIGQPSSSSTQLQQPQPPSDVTAFLIDEAYKLQEISLPAAHAYLQARLRTLLSGVQLSDRTGATRFFQAMHDELRVHPQAPLVDVSGQVVISLSAQQSGVMSQHMYVAPGSASIKQCGALFEAANFNALDARESLQQVLAFAHEKQLCQSDRDLYISRFACILEAVLGELKK